MTASADIPALDLTAAGSPGLTDLRHTNPQQCVYAGMHQDYSEGFVAGDQEQWPDETVTANPRQTPACW